MARRRLIAPWIWQSGHFKRLNHRQRLLWIGIITRSDDEGKLKGEPAVLRAEVFPFDKISAKVVDDGLNLLHDEGMIKRYEVAGDRYILIPKWFQYQRPSHASRSQIPNPDGSYSVSPELLKLISRNPRPQSSEGEVGKEKESEGQLK